MWGDLGNACRKCKKSPNLVTLRDRHHLEKAASNQFQLNIIFSQKWQNLFHGKIIKHIDYSVSTFDCVYSC